MAGDNLERVQRCIEYILCEEVNLGNQRARAIAAQFGDLKEFLDVDLEKLRKVKTITGKQMNLSLVDADLIRLEVFRKSGLLDVNISAADNQLRSMGRRFTLKQIQMLRGITLAVLSPNPFLVETLNLRTVEEFLRLNVYMFATRSIVTSMGYFVQDLLVWSSDSVTKVNKGWDLIKIKDDERHWIQVKSGPNDMDKDQTELWSAKFEQLEQGDRGYIGITYGKRGISTISLKLLKQFIPNHEVCVLIGRELWKFVSDDESYVDHLFDNLQVAAVQALNNRTITEEMEDTVKRVCEEFKSKYGEGSTGLNNYLAEMF